MISAENVKPLLIQKNKKNSFQLTTTSELFVKLDLERAMEQIVTEDDTPVDNLFSEKQQRLLVEPLYSSWRKMAGVNPIFWAAANIGLFNRLGELPVVPDMFLSIDVKVGENWYEKKNRSYFVWELGKPPEVVVEIISNKKGKEATKKQLKYAQIGVAYYVLYDPYRIIQNEQLKVFELSNGKYSLKDDYRLDKLGLSLALCKGFFEGDYKQWLRWCDIDGKPIQTGLEWGTKGWEKAEREQKRAELGWEKARQERKRAEQERKRAEQEQERAEKGWEKARQEQERAEKEQKRAEQGWEKAKQEQERAEKLAAQLRELGIEPE